MGVNTEELEEEFSIKSMLISVEGSVAKMEIEVNCFKEMIKLSKDAIANIYKKKKE